MTFPILETDRLKLIEVGPEYAQKLYEIFSLEEVTRNYGMDSMKSVEQAAKMIESFGNVFAENRGIRWGVVVKETNEFIGTAGLLHKNGFQQEGVLRGYLYQKGESHDASIYSIVKPDWEGLKGDR